MRLLELVEAYASVRDLSEGTIKQLRYAAIAVAAHLGREAVLEDLTADILNAWISARLKAGISRKTVQVQRGAILSLRREALRRKLVRLDADDIRQVRVPQPIPRAWLPEQYAAIVSAIDCLPGAFNCGVPRCLMMRAVAMLAYYSGLRPGDWPRLRSIDVLSGAPIPFRQGKTGVPIMIDLPDDCRAAIMATRPENREFVFPLSRKESYRWLRIVLTKASLPGSQKWFRRTGATRCEQQQPGSAMAYLGHKTPGLAYKHYVDQTQIQAKRPIPPKIA